MSQLPMISVISPLYGCKNCLELLCNSVSEAFNETELEWELVLVDDRGKDEPWQLICELAERNRRIRGIRLSRNHGQHLAIWAGLAETQGKWVAVIDCDLQDDPKFIPNLLKKALTENLHAVIVDRGTWSDTRFRRIASRIFYRLIDILGGVRINNVGNFGIYSRELVDCLLRFREQEVMLPMMVALTGLAQSNYRLNRSTRSIGNSSYSFLSLLRIAIAIVIRFSDRPLKLSVVLGLSISLISAAISIFLFISWIFGEIRVPGWTSSILSMWFLSGLILATLGVHGFYLGRVFSEVKNRPRIIIEAKTPNIR